VPNQQCIRIDVLGCYLCSWHTTSRWNWVLTMSAAGEGCHQGFCPLGPG
jgi:hypothetical protein